MATTNEMHQDAVAAIGGDFKAGAISAAQAAARLLSLGYDEAEVDSMLDAAVQP